MISRSLKRCRHGVVRTKGPIVWVSNSTSLRVMFMAAPHRADWCQNSLTRHPFGKVRNTSLIALYCSQVPEGHERWTLRMLADKMVELDIVDSVSHETVRRTLKKTNLNPGKRKNGVFHQNKTLPLSAKWRKS